MEAARLTLPEPSIDGRMRLGALLVRDGVITVQQLEEALAEKEETGRRLGEIAVSHGWVSGHALARALAEQQELDYVDLAQTDPDPAATALLPEKFARRYGALPVRFDDDQVVVAVADPTNVVASDHLRLALGLNVRFVVVAIDDLERTIARVYRSEIDVDHGDAELEIDEDGGFARRPRSSS